MKTRLDPYQAALFVLKTLRSYEDESGRQLSRFRISRRTLRIIAGRTHLREAFVAEVADNLRDLGWLMFESGDHYCFIRSARVDKWQRIAAKRIRDDLAEAQNSSREYDFDALASEVESLVQSEEVIEE